MKAKKAVRRKGSPAKKRKRKVIDTEKMTRQIAAMKEKIRAMAAEDGIEIDDGHVKTMKEVAEELQEINRGIRESLKRAMMADGKIKPGQELRVRDRIVKLKPRRGCPEGSMDPEHYDLVYEMIS